MDPDIPIQTAFEAQRFCLQLLISSKMCSAQSGPSLLVMLAGLSANLSSAEAVQAAAEAISLPPLQAKAKDEAFDF